MLIRPIYSLARNICVAILIGGLASTQATAEMALIGDVKIGGMSTTATAAHGAFDGNNIGDMGELLDLLNGTGDGSLVYKDPIGIEEISSVTFATTSTKMFSGGVIGGVNGPGTTTTMDAVDFFTGINTSWIEIGTTNADGSDGPGPFENFYADELSTGTLTLSNNQALNGDWVLALKINGGYSVYLFENLNAVTSFDFDTRSIISGNGKAQNLSHGTLYQGNEGSFITVPEPSTFLLWSALGIIGLAVRVRRRRD